MVYRIVIPMTTYEGWTNRATWNVSLWLNNTFVYYEAAVEFMKNYKGKQPYKDFILDCGLDTQRTPDGFKWISMELNYAELNQMMWEFRPNDWKSK